MEELLIHSFYLKKVLCVPLTYENKVFGNNWIFRPDSAKLAMDRHSNTDRMLEKPLKVSYWVRNYQYLSIFCFILIQFNYLILTAVAKLSEF